MKTYRNSSDGSLNIKTKFFTSGKMEVIQKSIFTLNEKTRSKLEINNFESNQNNLEFTCVGELRIKPYKLNSKKV